MPRNKRLAVIGAGAIGTDIAARLARSGADVRLIARGAQRIAIARGGITVDDGDERWRIDIPVFAAAAEAGPGDCVLLGVKAHQLADALPQIEPLLGAETAIVTLQNGYMQRVRLSLGLRCDFGWTRGSRHFS